MNMTFKSAAAVLALVGALGAAGQAQAVVFQTQNVNVDWTAYEDLTSTVISNGTIVNGSNQWILNNVLDNGGNDTGYKVEFSIVAPVAIAGWVFDHTEWQAGAGATAYGTATNNSGVSQDMTIVEGKTFAKVGFGSLGSPGTALASASSIALGSFNGDNGDPSVTLAPGDSVTLSANPVVDGLGPWVSNNSLLAYARGNASNTQQGSGNVDFSMTNRANFYVEARNIYRQEEQKVPEPGTLALMGLGLAGFAASRRKKQA